jgi:hypothetical protein
VVQHHARSQVLIPMSIYKQASLGDDWQGLIFLQSIMYLRRVYTYPTFEVSAVLHRIRIRVSIYLIAA